MLASEIGSEVTGAHEALARPAEPGEVARVPGVVQVHDGYAPVDEVLAVGARAFPEVAQGIARIDRQNEKDDGGRQHDKGGYTQALDYELKH